MTKIYWGFKITKLLSTFGTIGSTIFLKILDRQPYLSIFSDFSHVQFSIYRWIEFAESHRVCIHFPQQISFFKINLAITFEIIMYLICFQLCVITLFQQFGLIFRKGLLNWAYRKHKRPQSSMQAPQCILEWVGRLLQTIMYFICRHEKSVTRTMNNTIGTILGIVTTKFGLSLSVIRGTLYSPSECCKKLIIYTKKTN